MIDAALHRTTEPRGTQILRVFAIVAFLNVIGQLLEWWLV